MGRSPSGSYWTLTLALNVTPSGLDRRKGAIELMVKYFAPKGVRADNVGFLVLSTGEILSAEMFVLGSGMARVAHYR